MSEQIYRSKSLDDPFDTTPTHGANGWRYLGHRYIKVHFWGKGNQHAWITEDEFQSRKGEIHLSTTFGQRFSGTGYRLLRALGRTREVWG